MTQAPLLPCDGCGQLVGLPHISRRLQRLEWATRFRPVHIQALLLGGIVPERDEEFFYGPQATFQGESRTILEAVQMSSEGKSSEALLNEFQRLGLALTHILECPPVPGVSSSDVEALLEKQLPAAIARIRRSLKPKRVLLFSPELAAVMDKLHQADLGCLVLPVAPGLFFAKTPPPQEEVQAFRHALAIANAHSVWGFPCDGGHCVE